MLLAITLAYCAKAEGAEYASPQNIVERDPDSRSRSRSCNCCLRINCNPNPADRSSSDLVTGCAAGNWRTSTTLQNLYPSQDLCGTNGHAMTPDSSKAESNTASTSSEDSSSAAPIRIKCRVPGCPNSKCKLPTHLKYKPDTRVIPNREGRKKNVVSSDIGQLIRRDPRVDIQSDGVDGLPALPGNEQDPKLRLLFHHFFSSVFEPLAHIFRGPSVACMPEYKNRMLATALTSEGYCMGLIVQSQTDIDICRHETIEPRTSMVVYTKAVAVFRKQIEEIEKSPSALAIELALLTLCTLISYDAFHGRDTPVQTHWIGLQHLVERRGGLHCVKISLAYVVHVDRICAQRLNQRPAFSNPAVQLVPLPKPRLPRNGSALRDEDSPIRGSFMSHVIEHCIETCSLLELWDVSHSQAAEERRKGSSRTVPSLEYLYYIRDRVDEQYSVLHADLWGQDVRDRCLLWAARIIEYPVTWSNQIPTMNTQICGHLLQVLRTQDLSEVWKGNTNILVWILFALATVQTPFDGRDQVIVYLRRIMDLRHGDLQWPQHWWQAELENVQSYVWSNSNNLVRFYDVCHELQDGVTIDGSGSVLTSPDPASSSVLLTRREDGEEGVNLDNLEDAFA